ncbi:MAG: hypothetical protein IPJ93_13775 [Bacteroidota bacterium]|nr:MAG: hypothetical protein IPJ93_13775 [Bacteroidota bacterium]
MKNKVGFGLKNIVGIRKVPRKVPNRFRDSWEDVYTLPRRFQNVSGGSQSSDWRLGGKAFQVNE